MVVLVPGVVTATPKYTGAWCACGHKQTDHLDDFGACDGAQYCDCTVFVAQKEARAFGGVIAGALAILLALAATAAHADVAWISFDTCSGGNHYYNVTVGNVTRQTTGTCSVGSGTITSATGFVAGDVGKTLIVHGCGVSARSLIGTITARTTSSVTVNVNASTAATATTVLLMGATQVIPDDDSDEAVTFRLWLKRQLDRGKTRLHALGHIVIKDVP